MINVCSKCGTPHNREGQRYCLECHAAYQRQYRKRQKSSMTLDDVLTKWLPRLAEGTKKPVSRS